MTSTVLADWLRTRQGIAFVLGIVTLASVLLYLPTIEYDFVWDDTSLIVDNELLAESQPWNLFERSFWSGAPELPGGTAQVFYRPLVSLSFWCDLKVAGPNPAFFHLINLILNAFMAAMVALILWELLHSGVWAGLGGLLFAVHSSHVESTAFISGRTDLLLGLFIGIAAFAMLRCLRQRNFRWALLVPVGFALALLSKETAILFPVLLALAPLLTQTRYSRRYWLLIGVTVAVGTGYLLLRGHVVGAVLPVPLDAPIRRFVEVANTFGLYLRMFVWPFAHQVKFPADPEFANLTSNALFALLFVVGLPLLIIKRRFWVALLGFTWTILFLLPVSNIVPIGPQAAERLLYLPSAGLVILVITLLSRALHMHTTTRKFAGAGLAIVCIALGADSFTRLPVWRNEEVLFATMAAEAPRAPSAYANLANVVHAARPDSAIRLYRHAISLDQGYVRAHINVGILYSQRQEHRRALHHLRIADELRPNSVQVLNNLGLAYLAAEKPESALVYLDRAVAIETGSAQARLNRAIALNATGRSAAADSELYRAIEIKPDFIPARLFLAERFDKKGMLDSAARHLAAAIRIEPGQLGPCNRLGTILVQLGDSARAERYYLQALKLDSTFVPALFNQAILYAARGDTAAALKLAGRANRLRPDLAAVEQLCRDLGSPD